MKKVQLVAVGIGILLVAGVALGGLFRLGRGADASAEVFLQQELSNNKAALIEGFEMSKASPLFQGETFPILNYPVLRGNAPNWSQPSVVTLGRSASSSALDLYGELQGIEIQKIHVLSNSPYLPEDLERFPADVTILDGTDGIQGYGFNPSKSLHEALGVSASVSAYLLDSDRTVLYAQVNKGFYGGLAAAVNAFSREGAAAVEPNRQQLLPVGQALPLNVLSDDDQMLVQEELSKPVTLVLLSDKSWCDTCETWLTYGDDFFKRWRDLGYGLVIVESGAETASAERLPNDILEVSDTHIAGSSQDSELMSDWGATVMPATYILKDGLLQGQVSWLEVDIDGTPYRDLHFQAVDDIAQTLIN